MHALDLQRVAGDDEAADVEPDDDPFLVIFQDPGMAVDRAFRKPLTSMCGRPAAISAGRPSFMAAAARYERSFTVSTSPLSAGRGKRTALCSILMPDRLILSCRA